MAEVAVREWQELAELAEVQSAESFGTDGIVGITTFGGTAGTISVPTVLPAGGGPAIIPELGILSILYPVNWVFLLFLSFIFR
jgi:hypothetical protein